MQINQFCCCCGINLIDFSRPKPTKILISLSPEFNKSTRICNRCRMANYRKIKRVDNNFLIDENESVSSSPKSNHSTQSIQNPIKRTKTTKKQKEEKQLKKLIDENTELKEENMVLSSKLKEVIQENEKLKQEIKRKNSQIKSLNAKQNI
ncbi:nf-kappa-b essential modulator [Anaeramoeba ignava]|uniref:Nf-kappa-b essential modulator n=1 Tax=Anaeramoeba ignava TaxID=1746090 RepID=A0A9Q0LAA5_ANAIG|nr:nf-kappa-b essential modulator [Anaeramoeba ignava]